MRNQPGRLAADVSHPFVGCDIDRSRPLQFRLDGRVIHGFFGDTVLSAVMAAGVDTVGERQGTPIALAIRHAPAILRVDDAKDPARALPMERTAATDGADYLTIGGGRKRSWIRRMIQRHRRSLGVDLDRESAMARPWLTAPVEATLDADLVVIGGGVAGMTAALAGAARRQSVILIEASPALGGVALLFGSEDGQEKPDIVIARLSASIAEDANITVLNSSEAFALRPGIVRLHQIEMPNGAPRGRVVDIKADKIVLALGTLERLPVFPGNRLPGMVGAMEAFEMARRYGVWSGQTALLATGNSATYRVAMQAKDASLQITRIMDPRARPQSRFIEFSKAYGITLEHGAVVASAAQVNKGRQLAIKARASTTTAVKEAPVYLVDRLVVSGGWQPELTLWHMAGGRSIWRASNNRIEATTGPAGIALAGSVAGWETSQACMDSGVDAVERLNGQPPRVIPQVLIDPIYESRDAASWIGNEPDPSSEPAFLDGGLRYIERPRKAASRLPKWLAFADRQRGWAFGETPQPLDVADIAAGVQLGAIPADSAGIVAQERVAMVQFEQDASSGTASQPLVLPPLFLQGRFPDAALWRIAPDDPRLLDIGALIYSGAEHTDPLDAVGVVVRVEQGSAIALTAGEAEGRIFVVEGGRPTPARLIARFDSRS